eukprot:jgi/Botrbrau1/15045/Bobra.0297s0002.1
MLLITSCTEAAKLYLKSFMGWTKTVTSGNLSPELNIKGHISENHCVRTKLQAFKSMGTAKTRRLMSGLC